VTPAKCRTNLVAISEAIGSAGTTTARHPRTERRRMDDESYRAVNLDCLIALQADAEKRMVAAGIDPELAVTLAVLATTTEEVLSDLGLLSPS
jgi:hypothetical protein